MVSLIESDLLYTAFSNQTTRVYLRPPKGSKRPWFPLLLLLDAHCGTLDQDICTHKFDDCPMGWLLTTSEQSRKWSWMMEPWHEGLVHCMPILQGLMGGGRSLSMLSAFLKDRDASNYYALPSIRCGISPLGWNSLTFFILDIRQPFCWWSAQQSTAELHAGDCMVPPIWGLRLCILNLWTRWACSMKNSLQNIPYCVQYMPYCTVWTTQQLFVHQTSYSSVSVQRYVALTV